KALAGKGVEVEVEPAVEMMDTVFSLMAESISEEEDLPGLLSGEGVTAEGFTAFVGAAQRFFAAAPWRFLGNEDLVRVEAPEMGVGLRDVVLMGEGGMQFGLMFFNHPSQFEALCRGEQDETRMAMIEEGVWSVSFEKPEDVLAADLMAWVRHGFPKAGDDLLPIPARLGRFLGRPDARILAFFEGLLSAFAESTEEEIDSGRWAKKVGTARGPLHFRLALPGLLERMEEEARTEPLVGSEEDLGELAADLLVEAEEARGRQRIYLARRALEICPEMSGAYELLGDLAPDAQRALDLYTRGLALAERELDPEFFDEEPGAFAGLPEVTQYMSLRASIARTLETLGRPEEAAEHYEEILRLDPEDEMDVRYPLLDLLLEVLQRHEQAEQLLSRYEDDPDVGWTYAWALVGFLLEGDDSPEAERRLRKALRRNRYVPDFLLGWRAMPELPSPSFEPGSPEEAALYAGSAEELWESAPEALGWLNFWVPSLLEPEPARAGRKRSKTRRR
ncbi:MAG TPA: tetratricopeptide repeat protein, partial [Thermoanaerobaculia bacterium]